MRSIIFSLGFFLLSASGSFAVCLSCGPAPVETTSTSSASEIQFLGGLQWNFGTNAPELVLGFRETRTSSSDEVVGGKLDLEFPLNAHFLDAFTIRGMGLAGDRDVQGEFGLGLSGFDFKPLLAGGIQGPYVNGGVNYIFGTGFEPYLGANSLSRPHKPNTHTSLNCAAGQTLEPASLFGGTVSPSQVTDGKVCVYSLPPL